VLRDERVDGRHAGDVDDGDFGAGIDQPLQQRLHHDLRAGAVERADHRQRNHAVPELDHRRRQLQPSPLLPAYDFLAGFLKRFHRLHGERVTISVIARLVGETWRSVSHHAAHAA
jgi:hypothetical protein